MSRDETVDIEQFRMKSDAGLPVDVANKSEAFDYRGKPINKDDSTCVAKATYNPDSKVFTYYARYATSGFRSRSLFNPEENPVTELQQTNTTHGRERYEFRKIGEAAYKNYVKYLQNGHIALLRLAERGDS